MTTYFIFLIFLWGISAAEFVSDKQRLSVFAYAVAVVFIALRYETGNDWPTYQNVFEAVPSLMEFQLSEYFAIVTEFRKEYLFVASNVLVKSIFSDFQFVLVIATMVLLYSQYKFNALYTAYPVTVLACSVSWLLYSLYFSAVSQSIAIACFLLFVPAFARRKYGMAFICMLFALLFQVSSLMYFALFFFSLKKTNETYVVIVWLFACVNFLLSVFVGVDIAGSIIGFVLLYMPAFIQSKLQYYLLERGLISNALDIYFVGGVTFVVGGWMVFDKKKIVKSSKEWMFNACMYFVVFQALFVNYAVFRYRLLYLVFPFIFILLVNRYGKSTNFVKFFGFSAIAIVSLVYSYLYLNRESTINFVPYQNYLHVLLSGDEGDGMIRYRMMIEQIIRN